MHMILHVLGLCGDPHPSILLFLIGIVGSIYKFGTVWLMIIFKMVKGVLWNGFTKK